LLSLKVDLSGNKEARQAMHRLSVAAPDALHRVLQRFAMRVEGTAKRSLQSGDKSGRIYKLKGGKTHRASARGEAPATRTGRLVGSVTSHVTKIEAGIGSPLDYAAILEDAMGLDRPFIKPALDQHLVTLEEELLEAWARAAR